MYKHVITSELDPSFAFISVFTEDRGAIKISLSFISM